MSFGEIRLNVTTDGSGDGSATAVKPINGFVEAVHWIDGSFDDGVGGTFSVTKTASAVDYTVLALTAANADAVYYPRVIINDATGGTVSGEYVRPLVSGYLKLTVASGGSVKSGGAIIYYEEA
jgi:hypothetical protein